MNAPAFQLYAQDFLTGCIFLTNEEVGIYIRILTKQWTDGKIPKKRLGFLVGFEWVNFSDELKQKFIEDDDFIYNKRLEFEREKLAGFHKKQAENGKKGGRPRKTKTVEKSNNDDSLEEIKNPKETQTKTQIKAKKSLSIENEVEDDNKIESEKGKGVLGEKEKTELNYHFDSEVFRTQWKIWKAFRKKNHKFQYFNQESEQKALTRIFNLSKENENVAIDIIKQSIEKGWKDFYELKNGNNQIANNGFSNNGNNGNKVSGTSEIISGARYTEFT